MLSAVQGADPRLFTSPQGGSHLHGGGGGGGGGGSAISPSLELSLTALYTALYSLLFAFVYLQLWLILHYGHKRFSFQSVFLFLCLLWAALRTTLFSFYFSNASQASRLQPLAYWLLYCCPVCLQFFTLCLLNLYFTQKSYRDFRLQGVLDAVLSSKSYQTVYNRLTVEEATAAVKAGSGGNGLQGVSMRDSDQEDQDEG